MAKSELQLKALSLRRSGESIKDISKNLGIPLSTASVWLRDIELTPQQKERLKRKQIAAGHKGRLIGAEANKQKRLDRLSLAKEEANERIDNFSNQELFLVGLGLYWGEGAKKGTGSLAVINSDPKIISLMSRWFVECLGVEEVRFMPRVFINNTHQDREPAIIQFWSEILNIPSSQFRRTIYRDNGKKIYENHDMYYGVLALRIAKGTDLKYKILAYIERIADICRRSSVG